MKADDAQPVQERRGRGRPRVDEARSSVSTWVPASYHDRLIRIAQAQDKSVSAVVRQLLILRLPR